MNNLRRLAGEDCYGGNCDTVYAVSSGELVIQGQAVTAGLNLGDGEQAVRIPREILENPPDLQMYLDWRDYALEHSVPFSEYRA